MKHLRIVLVLSEPPLPFGHAVGRWFYVLLRGLVNRGHQVRAFVICGNDHEIAQVRDLFPAPDYDVRIYAKPTRSGLWKKWQTIRRPYSYTIHPLLRTDIQEQFQLGWDLLHLEGIWSGWLGEGFDPSKVVLNFHSLYDIDQDFVPVHGVMDWLHRRVRRNAEYRLLRRYGSLLTLTTRLKRAVATIAPGTPVHVVPLGLDVSLYPFIPAERRPLEPVVSLIGSMNWYPSYSAAIRLLTRLYPAIRHRVPNARVEVVGWEARKALCEHLTQPGVTVIENVPDTRSYFERAAVFLYAPQRGSGMKVKVLEAFAYGVPVVTTAEGIEGIEARDGIHVGCSEEDKGLVERVVALLNERSRQERQRQAARALVSRQCCPEVVLDALEACYADILARRERAVA